MAWHDLICVARNKHGNRPYDGAGNIWDLAHRTHDSFALTLLMRSKIEEAPKRAWRASLKIFDRESQMKDKPKV